jgi:hypothetical protein
VTLYWFPEPPSQQKLDQGQKTEGSCLFFTPTLRGKCCCPHWRQVALFFVFFSRVFIVLYYLFIYLFIYLFYFRKMNFFFLLFKNYCAEWRYIVAFTEVLTIYQIYHTWIHPFHHFPLHPPHSWNSFNRYHFSIYIHVYTVFAIYSPSHTLSLPPPPPTGTSPPGRTCSTLLFSNFVKEKINMTFFVV